MGNLERLRGICTRVIRRPNIGYDIGSYYAGWASLSPADLAGYRNIAFANDSVYGPIGSLNAFCRFIENMNYDMCGIVDSFERMYHIQSWFLVFKNNEMTIEYLNWFWQRFKFYNHRAIVIAFYEIGMTYLAIEYGLKVGAFAPYSKVRHQAELRSDELGYVSHTLCKAVSPMHYYWRLLIEDFSAPFLKRELLTENPRKIPDLAEIKKLAAERDYDIEMIAAHDTRNRWLRGNSAT
jgi:lipopolysaccharide biosynthesis protein